MKFAKHLLVAAIAATAFAAQAESDINTGAAAGLSASARLDFRVIVPKVIFLRVGTGTNFADNTAVDAVEWTLTAAQTIDAATGTGGAIADTSVSPVTLRVLGNGGNVTLSATGPVAGLTNAGGDAIAWTKISAAGGVTHPVVNGAGTTLTATGKIVNVTDSWTYSFNNNAAVAEGTYNGQVTYTAALP